MRFLKYIFYSLLLVLVASSAQAAISKDAFDQVLDLVEDAYSQDFLAQNQRLRVDRYWESEHEKASAWKEEDIKGETSSIRLDGGIARHIEITKDAFLLIVCHEVGHHIAGAPRIWKFSVEGQADYFGASECMRRLLPLVSEDDQVPYTPAAKIVRSKCARVFADQDERALCIRIAWAGEALSRFFADHKKVPSPNFEIRDQTIVVGVMSGPASPQCRLDTYLAAALCDQASNVDAAPGQQWLCQGADNPAARPACWFAE